MSLGARHPYVASRFPRLDVTTTRYQSCEHGARDDQLLILANLVNEDARKSPGIIDS